MARTRSTSRFSGPARKASGSSVPPTANAVGAEAGGGFGASPPARRIVTPRWRDARLVIGVLLVVVAVALGTKVVGSAQAGDIVWAAARDLPAGTVVRGDDLEPVSVRLGASSSSYLDASGDPPAGYVLTRDIHHGELVPATAMRSDAAAEENRLVSVPVEVNHFPAALARGQRVDLYVVVASQPGAPAPSPELVLTDARVSDVSTGIRGLGATSSTVGVVLAVAAEDAAKVVAAVGHGTIQLVLVPGAAS